MVRALCVLTVLALPGLAELTREQRQADFRHLVDMIAKRYAPYEWKRDGLKVDALAIGPWLERVNRAQNDLEFFEVCAEYVAGLRDSHSGYLLPSSFSARRGFTADLYEGRILVDSIDRTRLKAEDFPFEIGDELVMMDGLQAADLARSLARFNGEGTAVGATRSGIGFLTSRPQRLIPRAHEVGEMAKVTIKRANGENANYDIPWLKSGMPVVSVPDSPPVRTAAAGFAGGRAGQGGGLEFIDPTVDEWKNWRVRDRVGVTGLDGREPVFALPEDIFVRRNGNNPNDAAISGIFTVGGRKIGYVRVPTFGSFQARNIAMSEIRYFGKSTDGVPHTDGLIIDVMRNTGGVICFAEDLVSVLAPEGFKAFTGEIRVTWLSLLSLRENLETSRRLGVSETRIKELETVLGAYEDAYKAGKPRTAKLPLCGSVFERAGSMDGEVSDAYAKPVMVLQDEFSASASEIFAAQLQDMGRARIVGMRSLGAGGSVLSGNTGVYAEAGLSFTNSLGIRQKEVQVEGLPAAPYIENLGVAPDVVVDVMTRENLTKKGRPFLDRVLEIAVGQIGAAK
ncbi:MAG: hypothetical protein FJW40_27405 [Acidobacteria bacterium]|nr:hypothetical protein [Acidobacteriota bacterium]